VQYQQERLASADWFISQDVTVSPMTQLSPSVVFSCYIQFVASIFKWVPHYYYKNARFHVTYARKNGHQIETVSLNILSVLDLADGRQGVVIQIGVWV
jgi:hypothetical protein